MEGICRTVMCLWMGITLVAVRRSEALCNQYPNIPSAMMCRGETVSGGRIQLDASSSAGLTSCVCTVTVTGDSVSLNLLAAPDYQGCQSRLDVATQSPFTFECLKSGTPADTTTKKTFAITLQKSYSSVTTDYCLLMQFQNQQSNDNIQVVCDGAPLTTTPTTTTTTTPTTTTTTPTTTTTTPTTTTPTTMTTPTTTTTTTPTTTSTTSTTPPTTVSPTTPTTTPTTLSPTPSPSSSQPPTSHDPTSDSSSASSGEATPEGQTTPGGGTKVSPGNATANATVSPGDQSPSTASAGLSQGMLALIILVVIVGVIIILAAVVASVMGVRKRRRQSAEFKGTQPASYYNAGAQLDDPHSSNGKVTSHNAPPPSDTQAPVIYSQSPENLDYHL